ncbi:MAG: phosphoribosylformylglycinamidine synthase subunit PurS, partial [Candidatus Subteraquimicrobiales bacterium]|nr:phosphoribosylformylglycinamidine synthase subunit PurS [Candidatus Subteraquimicrobiales bacterium]
MKRMWRIEVGFKQGVVDALGNSVKKSIIEDLRIAVDCIETVDVYTIKAALSEEQVKQVAQELLTDPITQESSYNSTLAKGFSKLIEVGYKPGVTDNVGRTTVEGIEDLLRIKLKEDELVHTSRLYLIMGNITDEEAERIATGLLANPIIEHYAVYNEANWLKHNKLDESYFITPSKHKPAIAEINLDVSDEELLEISYKGVLSLNLEEMQTIRAYFKNPQVIEEREKVGLPDKPTDVELEMIAQTWSEHCKH